MSKQDEIKGWLWAILALTAAFGPPFILCALGLIK